MDCNESVSKVETIFFARNLTKKSNDKKIIKGITKEFQINVYFLDKKHKIKRIVKSIKILWVLVQSTIESYIIVKKIVKLKNKTKKINKRDKKNKE